MHVVIWDLDDTLYNRHLQVGEDYSGLHDVVLFPDALSVLTRHDQIDILVTKETKEGAQDAKLDALGIREHFEEIYKVPTDEAKKEVFAAIRERYSVPIYVVGDRINSEIRNGNELGFTTVLCPRGKYLKLELKDESEKPDFVIKDLTELRKVTSPSVEIIFEPHATSVDNEKKLASGWSDPKLSKLGLKQARELGERYADKKVDAVFCSGMQRAYVTAEIAFGDRVPIIRDERLRECNYGELNGRPEDEVKPQKLQHINKPFPNGQSYIQTTEHMKEFLKELLRDHNGKRVMIIGHRATQYALEHLILGKPLEEVIPAPWKWQPGWTYTLKALH